MNPQGVGFLAIGQLGPSDFIKNSQRMPFGMPSAEKQHTRLSLYRCVEYARH